MTNLFLTEKVNTLLAAYQQFLKDDVYPIELAVIKNPFRQSLPLLNSLRSRAKEKKLWAPHLSESEGGVGLSLTEFAHVSEMLGTSPIGHYLFNCQAPDIGNMELLQAHASEELKKNFLLPLMHGDIRSCFAMTEPEFAGSNPVHLAATAVRDGNEYIINGHKWFTTGADGASFVIVMATTDALNSSPYSRASMILVPIPVA